MDELAKNLPAIIGAAAQSNLGMLALFAIALAVLAYLFFARASEKARIGIFVLMFCGVAGFGAAMFDTHTAANSNAEKPTPTASRDFVVGRWQVEQALGQISGGTVIDYQDDGMFVGSMTQFVGGTGQKIPTRGIWKFEKLSPETFQLKVQFENSGLWQGTFRILDENHIHNIDENYIAVRVR